MLGATNASPGASRLKGLAKSSTLNLVGGVANGVLVLLTTILLTSQLGEGLSGAMFSSFALFQVVIVVSALGVETGMVRTVSGRHLPDSQYQLKQLLKVGLGPTMAIATGIAVAGFFSAPWLGSILGDNRFDGQIATAIRILALFVPLAAPYLSLLGVTRGYGTMRPTVAFERVGRPALQLVLLVGAIVADMGAGAFALAWCLPYLVGMIGAGTAVYRLNSVDPHRDLEPAATRAAFRSFWSFTLPRAAGSSFAAILQWLDVVFVAALSTPEAAAIYTVASRLVQFGTMATYTISQSTEPRFGSALAEGDQPATLHLYQTSTAWLIALTWPIYIITAVFAPGLLQLFGDAFIAGTTTVTILIAAVLIGAALGPVDVLLLMTGRSTLSLWNSGISVAVHIGLNILLIPRIGIVGAAIAWAANRVLGNLLAVLQVHHYYALHPFGRGWKIAAMVSFVIFAGIGATARAILGTSLVVGFGAGVVGLAVYFVVLRRYGEALEVDALSSVIPWLGRKAVTT